jgi:tetratricopeptide (TPR) repeat protein
MTGPDDLLRQFREKFQKDPVGAFREWFRLQEDLRDAGDAEKARALADDFADLLPQITFPSESERARFFHNAAVFFGSPGPAADLARARECFAVALEHFDAHEEGGWRARALHNLATSLSNLGETEAQLTESIALFEQALAWRTPERQIARGVTLHNMGLALRRLANLAPERSAASLEASAAALGEAAEIRARHNLAEGHALSIFHLALTLEQAGRDADARSTFERAAMAFERLGKRDSAAIAAGRAASL